ncbi:hypothetical protein, conserved [Leishmania tarentolae]|uniref:Protein kinase domain-containing protein n=1 Tax=Leishmania tarentolae TaxID=5689 RepID=A0A640KPC9_LEITA|nr:hypothetical protein, conserved [Leishmania tarentolae]
MNFGDLILDCRYTDSVGHQKMNEYWVLPRVSHECVNKADGSRSFGNDCSDSSSGDVTGTFVGDNAVQQWYSYPGILFPPSHKPLVEDDVEGDDRSSEDSDDNVAKAALEHFLRGSSGGFIEYSALERDGQASNRHQKSSSPSSTTIVDSNEGGVPCIQEELLGDLGDVIGYGGDRGSFVCCVPLPPLSHTWKETAIFAREPTFLHGRTRAEVKKAYKKYPTHISKEELSFVSTAHRSARNREHRQINSSRSGLKPEEAHYASRHLVLPEAVVVAHDQQVGLLMPLYNCSLKEYLQSLTNPASLPSAASTTPDSLTVIDNANVHVVDANRTGLCNPYSRTFRFTANYRPVESIPVVSAIVFQVLEAVTFLNHHLPHGNGSTGYTHNDIHLDNILLSYDGNVALCDFELVASTPTPSRTIDIRRLPPSSRQSPHGLFSETADTWALGLMVVSLLTGVDPLFTSDIVNDFSDGPLLVRWDQSTRVLDWEANIKAHVELLLQHLDSTGKRLEEARHLLDLCGKCLVNREGAEPLRAVSLLEEAMFLPYRQDLGLATRTVKEWIRGMRWV